VSIVPNDRLKSADSLELIIFPVKITDSSAAFQLDMWTQRRAFWKSAVLRNRQAGDLISYRTAPNDTFETLAPNSEVPIKGWGSFFEVASAAATPAWVLDLIAVTYVNALRVGSYH